MSLTDSVAQYVMSEVFSAIDHRLSEEYTKIEFPTLGAKELRVHLCTSLYPI